MTHSPHVTGVARQPDVPGRLLESRLDPDPHRQFALWMEEAQASGEPQPVGATLATTTPEGAPSARVVLVRGWGPDGFVFYTNYDSRKGRELAANPRAALVFWWSAVGRQVRVEGRVEKVEPSLSDAYFAERPRGSRISAWASRQSDVVESREALDARCREIEARYDEGEVPRPPNWGGYRLRAEDIEFWQECPDRLHDRLRYRREGDRWRIERLAP